MAVIHGVTAKMASNSTRTSVRSGAGETISPTRPEPASFSTGQSANPVHIILPSTLIPIAGIIVTVCIILIFRRRKNHRVLQNKIGVVHYIEIWNLVNKRRNDSDFERKLLTLAKRLTEMETHDSPHLSTRQKLFDALCEWKISTSEGDVDQGKQLYIAMKSAGLAKEFKEMIDYRKERIHTLSDNQLKHLCWCLTEHSRTVNVNLRSLWFPSTPVPEENISEVKNDGSTKDRAIGNEFRLLSEWRTSMESWDPSESTSKGETRLVIKDDEMVPLTGVVNQEEILNQRVKMCRALEEEDLHLVAKTFFQINENNLSLSEDDVRAFAYKLSGRHCLKISQEVDYNDKEIYHVHQRIGENFNSIFHVDKMLNYWIENQQYSNYDIRCTLRNIAIESGRFDISDAFIEEDQSCIYRRNVDSFLSFENEQLNRTQVEISVDAISDEELERICLYTGDNVFQDICSKFDVKYEGDSGSHERHRKAIQDLKEKLNELKSDSAKHNAFFEDRDTTSSPRKTVRKILEEVDSAYGHLLPEKTEDLDVFKVELVDLAFYLLMGDIYEFAKLLGYSDYQLTKFKADFQPENLEKGSYAITTSLSDRVHPVTGNSQRNEVSKILTCAGYPAAARLIEYDCSIGLGDILAVANAVDGPGLAKALGFSEEEIVQYNDVGGALTAAVLRDWRRQVHPPSVNKRTTLADIVHGLGHTDLALGIISGKYRYRAVAREEIEKIARHIDQNKAPALCKALSVGGTAMNSSGNTVLTSDLPIQDIILKWTRELRFVETPLKELSDELLNAGCYEFALEIMTGLRRRKYAHELNTAGCQLSDVSDPDEFLTVEEVQRFVAHLTGRHCRRLADALGPECIAIMEKTVEVIIQENNETIFKSTDLIIDWLNEQNCDDNDKRNKLHDCVRDIGRGNVEDYTWIEDVELQKLVVDFSSDMTVKLCETLNIKFGKQSDVKQSLLKAVRGWRDAQSSAYRKPYTRFLETLRDFQRAVIRDPEEKLRAISLAELHDIALELFMQDLRPFTTSIGVDEERLNQYKRKWNESNRGTLCLLQRVATDELDRTRLYRTLKYCGYCRMAQMIHDANYEH